MLPLRLSLWLGVVFGWVWYYLVPVRRRVARVNVARVFGASLSPRAQRRLVRANFVHLATSAIELLRIPRLTPAGAEATPETVTVPPLVFRPSTGSISFD